MIIIKHILCGVLLCISFSQICDPGYTEINNLCFHQGDLSLIQKMIDNSYESGIDLGCNEGDPYCGSPNPYMDAPDSWFWVTVDSVYYQWPGNDNGLVEPLELGIQDWNNGRLTSIMCGAYIYCQLSGPIPEEINILTETTVFRFEYNYLSGFIPGEICDLDIDNADYLDFDLTGNRLCPPFPECISQGQFWYQDSSECTQIGDSNFDFVLNIQDIIILVSFILGEVEYDYQEFIASDYNQDGVLDIIDAIRIIDVILGVN